MKQNRYLLQVRLSNGTIYKRTFTTEQAMNDYILERDFFFITANYNYYDLAIQLKG